MWNLGGSRSGNARRMAARREWARKRLRSLSPRRGRTASRVTASQPPSSSSTLAGASSPMDGPPAAGGPGGRTVAA